VPGRSSSVGGREAGFRTISIAPARGGQPLASAVTVGAQFLADDFCQALVIDHPARQFDAGRAAIRVAAAAIGRSFRDQFIAPVEQQLEDARRKSAALRVR